MSNEINADIIYRLKIGGQTFDFDRGGVEDLVRTLQALLGGKAKQQPKQDGAATIAPMQQGTWTDEEISELRTAATTGVPIKDVALKLGRGIPATYAKAASLGIRPQNGRAEVTA